MYTFEWKWSAESLEGSSIRSDHDGAIWYRSKQVLETIERAAEEATKWLAVCCENDCPVIVRMVKLSPENS